MSSLIAGNLKKSRLEDPTQCSGFSSAAGARRNYPSSGIINQARAFSLMEPVSRPEQCPLQVEPLAEARERPAPSLVETLSLADDGREVVGLKHGNRPTFIRRHNAQFVGQVGVEFQGHLSGRLKTARGRQKPATSCSK